MGDFAYDAKLAMFQAKTMQPTIGPAQTTIPALQGVPFNLPKPPGLPPTSIAQPVFNLPKPKPAMTAAPSSALGNVFDPFVKGAKEVASDVLGYKMAIAQIKQSAAETGFYKKASKQDNSTPASSPSFGLSGGGGGAPAGSSDSGNGFDATTLILIGLGLVAIFVVAKH